VYDDGGRSDAGYRGSTRDCVTRAIAIATGVPYQEVYSMINEESKRERPRGRKKRSAARTGVKSSTVRRVMVDRLGWSWTSTMHVGSGCTVHLRADELPPGKLVVNVSRHTVAVIDGVVHDTYDPARNGTRCVYGYFSAE
jgi:hypothetical protein